MHKLSIIETPTGRFVFVGSVPGSLGYVDAATGEDATEEQLQRARSFGPRIAGVKSRAFETRDEAVAFAAAHGYEV